VLFGVQLLICDAQRSIINRVDPMNISVFLMAIFSICLNAFAQIALRKTMLTVGMPNSSALPILSYLFNLAITPWFVAGMTCYAFSIGVWMLVLGKVEVSLAYPLLSIGYVIAAIIGYFYLGESVGVMRIAGISLICVGIIVLSRGA
jgi:multidrug transporter EmrE-like cation transporter